MVNAKHPHAKWTPPFRIKALGMGGRQNAQTQLNFFVSAHSSLKNRSIDHVISHTDVACCLSCTSRVAKFSEGFDCERHILL